MHSTVWILLSTAVKLFGLLCIKSWLMPIAYFSSNCCSASETVFLLLASEHIAASWTENRRVRPLKILETKRSNHEYLIERLILYQFVP